MARHRPGPSGPAVRRPGCPSFPVLVHEADSHGTLTGRRRHPFESVLQLWAGHFPCLGAVLRAEPLWVETFTGLRLRQFEGLLRAVPERGGDGPRTARPWCLPLADRVLVVAVHYRTNLTMRHLAPLFGVSCGDRVLGDSATRSCAGHRAGPTPGRCHGPVVDSPSRHDQQGPEPQLNLPTRTLCNTLSVLGRVSKMDPGYSGRSCERALVTAPVARFPVRSGNQER